MPARTSRCRTAATRRSRRRRTVLLRRRVWRRRRSGSRPAQHLGQLSCILSRKLSVPRRQRHWELRRRKPSLPQAAGIFAPVHACRQRWKSEENKREESDEGNAPDQRDCHQTASYPPQRRTPSRQSQAAANGVVAPKPAHTAAGRPEKIDSVSEEPEFHVDEAEDSEGNEGKSAEPPPASSDCWSTHCCWRRSESLGAAKAGSVRGAASTGPVRPDHRIPSRRHSSIRLGNDHSRCGCRAVQSSPGTPAAFAKDGRAPYILTSHGVEKRENIRTNFSSMPALLATATHCFGTVTTTPPQAATLGLESPPCSPLSACSSHSQLPPLASPPPSPPSEAAHATCARARCHTAAAAAVQ
jgi:hypothetical protein